MSLPTTTMSCVPARLAFAASIIFAAASITTNATYGWGKGLDLASSAIWAGVSIAAGFTQVLSWPALVLTIDRRQWGKALAASCALLICGSYSVIAALGSASGGRTNAVNEERTVSDTRARTQATYETAKNELTALKASRSVAELEALLAAQSAQLRGRGCAVENGTGRFVCPKNATLVSELGRAKRRAELETRAEKARGELDLMYTPRQANSDMHALAGYLMAFGMPVSGDTLNKALILLAVITIEMGGGLALTLAMSLSDKGSGAQPVQTSPVHPQPQEPSTSLNNQGQIMPTRTVHSPAQTSRDRLLDMVRDAQGGLRTGHRGLGEQLGVSATRAGQLLRDLAADGSIRVRSSKTGSVITLAPRVVEVRT